MKSISRVFSLLLLLAVLLSACQNDEEELPAPADVEPEGELIEAADTSLAAVNAWVSCRTFVLPGYFMFDYKPTSLGNCTYQFSYICYKPGWIIEIPCILKIPEILPPSPFEIAKVLPPYIFEDFRKINPEIAKLKSNGVTFPITKSVVGVQFYGENKIINRQGFYLLNDLLLTAEEQKALGVTGKKIPAGKYPVIHNPQNNTFNAIVAVK